MNNVYNILEAYCRKNSELFDFDVIIKDFQKKEFYGSPVELRNLLLGVKKPESLKWEGGSSESLRKYCSWVRKLHFLYGIPFEAFDVPYEYIYADDINKIKPLNILNLGKPEGDLVQSYISIFNEPLKSLRESLIVYDYLEKYSHGDVRHLEQYHSAHKELYVLIEKAIERNIDKGQAVAKFKYIRYLALPYEESLNSLSDDPFELTKKALLHCSLQLFTHIVSTLHQFKELCDGPPTGSGFYVLLKPSRNYHYAVFDSGKYVMSEYYRYSRKGLFKPDILFVEKGSKDYIKLANIYKMEHESLHDIENFDDPPKSKIRFADIRKAILKNLEELEKMKSGTENEIEGCLATDTDQGIIAQLYKKQGYIEKLINATHQKLTILGRISG
ncbi:MAG: hypothetical protein RIC35_02595 [Marinoscillum sp.]